MKKLYKLILTTYAGPFVVTFFVSLFILLMQFLWKYVDDMVGKGLEWYIIAELLFYYSASLIPMALPLAILLSSIMTFGNMGEHYELVAIKSAGIPLKKLMRPMIVLMVFMSIAAFFISNVVIPKAMLKGGSLLWDVRQKKPAFNLKEGVFYKGIEGYSIKVGKKNPDGQTLEDIMIYDHTAPGSVSVLIAKSGKMAMSDDKQFLFFTLLEGKRYEEMVSDAEHYNRSYPHNVMTFEEEQVAFDLSEFKLTRTREELFRQNYQMLNVRELRNVSDSMNVVINEKRNLVQSQLTQYFHRDSVLKKYTAAKTTAPQDNFILNFDRDQRETIYRTAINNARIVMNTLEYNAHEISAIEKSRIRHDIEWHRKYTLSVACLVLFFIGAPLGAIIRKGGLGMPVVVSVILFILFHVMSITGEKFAREGILTPFEGMWFATGVLLPLGIYLTYKASVDSSLFNIDGYMRFFKRFMRKKADS